MRGMIYSKTGEALFRSLENIFVVWPQNPETLGINTPDTEIWPRAESTRRSAGRISSARLNAQPWPAPLQLRQ
ncbi:hypothetical protein EVAR_80988_1 [Eumeta japonica]|uniref:Uncharacterized protein n=1 Tax=Eumeta variegata TaxID=151549 RepID=A0A4C1WNG9_EUMVA|nr:hypothetical protein EVAR_80988_1 [Eumeta japonica]